MLLNGEWQLTRYLGRMTDLERVLRTFPKTGRMVSEYGAQDFPIEASCREFVRGEWPNLNWEEIEDRHRFQRHIMGRFVDPAAYDSFAVLALRLESRGEVLSTNEYRLRLRPPKGSRDGGGAA